ncbi:MAG: type II secretion system protein [Planctomycetota bacterium]|nr:type II secretion system protein [Planctomycetota bacterium]
MITDAQGPRRSRPRGFTLLEMMVVVAVTLGMVVIIVPVFQVSTRTVSAVQRKLSVYEAARNTLDIIHFQIMAAVTNERGEQFSIKSAYYDDTDPFTVANPDPNARYARSSRREADALQYVVINAGMNPYRDNAKYQGSYTFPIGYPGTHHTFPEAYKASLRSTLIYPKRDDYDWSGNVTVGNAPKPVAQLRSEQLADVNQVELTNLLFATNNESIENWPNAWTYVITPKDPILHFFAAGNEPKYSTPIYGDIGRKNQARMSGIRIMDLDVAYWDEGSQRFKNPPDNSVIYFAPPPKAVRVTVTVCDAEKRLALTLARVVQLPCGSNPATHVSGGGGAAPDWIRDDDGDYALPLPCNQFKNLKTLEPTLYN